MSSDTFESLHRLTLLFSLFFGGGGGGGEEGGGGRVTELFSTKTLPKS